MRYVTEDGESFDDIESARQHEHALGQTRELESVIHDYVQNVIKNKPGASTTRMINALLSWERYKVSLMAEPGEAVELDDDEEDLDEAA